MGNTVEKKNSRNTVETRQEIIPSLLREMDDYYDAKSGTGITHEILESYVGGLNAKETGKSISDSKKDDKSYKKAHNDKRVPQQSGPLINRFYDSKGKEVSETSSDIKEGRQSFEKKGKEPQVIMIIK